MPGGIENMNQKANMDQLKNEPAYSIQVLEFIKAANDFCVYLENIDTVEKMQAANYFSRIIPLLYLKASLLPEIKPEDDSANEKFVTQEQYQDIFNKIRTKLMPDDEFWFVDPSSPDTGQSKKGSLAEKLADAYQDIKDFIILYQKNSKSAKQNAVKECSKMFRQRWGLGLINVLGILHTLIFSGEYFDDTVEDFLD